MRWCSLRRCRLCAACAGPAHVLGCHAAATGNFDFAAGAHGEQGDPVEIARARLHDRLHPGDEVRSAGYPGAPERHVIVVRDGTTVADLTYVRDDGGTGWFEGAETTCTGFEG